MVSTVTRDVETSSHENTQMAPEGNPAISQATIRALLVEIERRGIVITEQGYYQTIGIDMAIGARNLLDMLPVSILEARGV